MYESLDCPDGTNESSVVCSPQCSQTYYDRVGTVTFPHNLGESLKRINCAYDIIQEQGSYMKIKEINLSLPCGIAFLEVRDGPNEDSPLMGRFCNENDKVPNNLASSQNHIVMRWVNSSVLVLFFHCNLFLYIQNLRMSYSFLTESIQTIKKEAIWDSVYPTTHTLNPHQ